MESVISGTVTPTSLLTFEQSRVVYSVYIGLGFTLEEGAVRVMHQETPGKYYLTSGGIYTHRALSQASNRAEWEAVEPVLSQHNVFSTPATPNIWHVH